LVVCCLCCLAACCLSCLVAVVYFTDGLLATTKSTAWKDHPCVSRRPTPALRESEFGCNSISQSFCRQNSRCKWDWEIVRIHVFLLKRCSNIIWNQLNWDWWHAVF
jgi:hypothetical protein